MKLITLFIFYYFYLVVDPKVVIILHKEYSYDPELVYYKNILKTASLSISLERL
jgi:hypothetical protein